MTPTRRCEAPRRDDAACVVRVQGLPLRGWRRPRGPQSTDCRTCGSQRDELQPCALPPARQLRPSARLAGHGYVTARGPPCRLGAARARPDECWSTCHKPRMHTFWSAPYRAELRCESQRAAQGRRGGCSTLRRAPLSRRPWPRSKSPVPSYAPRWCAVWPPRECPPRASREQAAAGAAGQLRRSPRVPSADATKEHVKELPVPAGAVGSAAYGRCPSGAERTKLRRALELPTSRRTAHMRSQECSTSPSASSRRLLRQGPWRSVARSGGAVGTRHVGVTRSCRGAVMLVVDRCASRSAHPAAGPPAGTRGPARFRRDEKMHQKRCNRLESRQPCTRGSASTCIILAT